MGAGVTAGEGAGVDSGPRSAGNLMGGVILGEGRGLGASSWVWAGTTVAAVWVV